MSKLEKLIERFLSKPTDFTWQELEKLLKAFGYENIGCGKTGGSRVKFRHEDCGPIVTHKPHPKSHLKMYQMIKMLQILEREGFL